MKHRIAAACIMGAFLGVTACGIFVDSWDPVNGAFVGTVVLKGAATGVSGIRVLVQGTESSTLTAAEGSFELSSLPAGTYTIEVQADGFNTYVLPGVEITAGIKTDLGRINMLPSLPLKPGLSLAGTVTTIAGKSGETGSADGTGTAALFNNPRGVTTDWANLYVVDAGNNTIRTIVLATGEVSTLAGTAGQSGSADGTGTAARFNNPQGVTTDGNNLYVVDQGNYTIRKIVIATATVSTFAGSPGQYGAIDGTGTIARFSVSMQGITTDGVNLYLLDSANGVRKIVMATAEVSTLSAKTGQFISTDGTNLFLTDSFAIRQLNISTLEEKSLWGFGIDWMASASDGYYFYGSRDQAMYSLLPSMNDAAYCWLLAGQPYVVGGADGTGGSATFGVNMGSITMDDSHLYLTDGTTVRMIR
jgi:hypothetical protein